MSVKITLIKPTIGRLEHSLYVDEGRMEPLMLGVLAGLTPEEHDVVLYDDRMESIPYDEPTDLVALTIETYTARRAYEIAAEYRKRNVSVIMGGMHVMLAPHEVKKHADSIFIGDAETLWGKVLEDVSKNRLEKIYKAPVGVAQVGGIKPKREIYQDKGYLPVSLMQFSRGCHFECSFCAVSKYFNRKHYIRRIDEVLEEIEDQGRRFVFFVDDNIASNRMILKEFCRALVPMKINWISQASLNITHDTQLMELMAESGCIGNVMGFESITRSSLKDGKKAANICLSSGYENEIRVLRDHAMQTWAAFTLGYDSDTYDSIMETMEFARKNRFTFAAFNLLMPYPNTPLYEKLAREERLLYGGQWWLHPEYRFNHAAFIPKNMTSNELSCVCHEARTQFNSIPSIIYRFSDVKTNLQSLWRATLYWRYASLFRKEVYKKHGMKFGLK